VSASSPAIGTCLNLTRAIGRARAVEEIYDAALEALAQGLRVERASILLFDDDRVMRFKAWRSLSPAYRKAVEGHTPWSPETADAEPIVVPDVLADPELKAYLPTFEAEGIRALAFIPLVNEARVIGKFMLYYAEPHALGPAELELAGVVAAQVAFAVARKRAEERALRSEARLRFALEAARMGTWDWDLLTNRVQWSENLERIHGLPPGTFDGSFASYEREIHPEDHERVMTSARRALEEGTPHEVEYRIVAPDGTVRWVEGKGRVEHVDGRPVSMSGVCMDVTRRKEAELARLDAAHEAARVKDEFLAVLSHELRTPLNAVLGWVHILQSGRLSPGLFREAVEIIARNARLQAQLIEDILDVSRIAAGKLELERQPLLVAEVVEAAANAVRPEALKRNIELVTALGEGLPPIEGDAKRLQQVLGNLLSNALKFTPEGGRISVRCEAAADEVLIAVRDTGIGIEPALQASIFERFRQADSRTTRRHGGLGLGLAIARHLVEQHGGSLSVESEGSGRGATFTLRLPAAAGAAPAVPAVPRRRRHEFALSGMRVLVVDDDTDARELVTALLRDCGAQAIPAACAATALEALGRERFDVMVADIAMPEIDGYELVRRAKAGYPDLAAIALTACARPQDRTLAFESGFDAYESKPFEPSRLVAAIAELHPPGRSR
jgi:PAS domain S-box-containing protein